jgi:GNAT superfamily N-acetyltransferase
LCGVEIHSLAKQLQADPDCLHQLADLLSETLRGDGAAAPFLPVSARSLADASSRGMYSGEHSWIARVGRKYVAVTLATATRAGVGSTPATLYFAYTGVRKEFRRRGIATALKAESLRASFDKGLSLVCAAINSRKRGAIRLNNKIGLRLIDTEVTREKLLRPHVNLDRAALDRFAGDYLPQIADRGPGLAGIVVGQCVQVRRFADALYAKAGPMHDRLWAASETEFFVKEHFGVIRFIPGRQGESLRLLYREGDVEVEAIRQELL